MNLSHWIRILKSKKNQPHVLHLIADDDDVVGLFLDPEWSRDKPSSKCKNAWFLFSRLTKRQRTRIQTSTSYVKVLYPNALAHKDTVGIGAEHIAERFRTNQSRCETPSPTQVHELETPSTLWELQKQVVEENELVEQLNTQLALTWA